MKLHLPLSLRSSLLACLSAFASILPSTVASSSALIAAGAFSFSLTQQAQAEEDDDEDAIAPFAIEGDWATAPQVTDADSWGSFFSTEGANAAGQKVALNASGFDLGSTARTIAADVWVESFSPNLFTANLTFSGAGYGSGDINLNGANNKNFTLTISGDWSAYTGNISIANTGNGGTFENFGLIFSGENAQSGSGDITIADAKRPWVAPNYVKVQNGATLNNNSISVAKVIFAGASTLNVNTLNATYGVDIGNGANVTFQAGESGASDVTIRSQFTNIGSGGFLMQQNSQMTLQDGVGMLLTGGSALSVWNDCQINLESGSTLTLDTVSTLGISRASINVKTGSTFNINGIIKIDTGNASTLSMQGGSVNLTGTATFYHVNGTTGSVTIANDAALTISDTSNFGGTLTMNGGTLNVGGNVTLNTINGTGGTVDVTGTLNITGGTGPSTLKLTNGGTLNVTSALSGISNLSVVESGTLTLGATLDLTATTLTATPAEGASAVLLTLGYSALTGNTDTFYGLKLTSDQLTNFGNYNLMLALEDAYTGMRVRLLDLAGIDDATKQDFLQYLDKAASGLGRAQNFAWTDDGYLTVVGAGDLIWNAGSGEWSNDDASTAWLLGTESSYFVANDSVIFGDASGSSEGTVTIANDGVTAGNMTVSSGTWTFTGGSLDISRHFTVSSGSASFTNTSTTWAGELAVTGKAQVTLSSSESITGSGISVGDGCRVEVGGEGTKSLGTVKIGEGASFVISSATGWDASTKLTGANGDGSSTRTGSLVISGIDYSEAANPNTLFQAILNNNHSIKELHLTDGTTFSQGYPNQSGKNKTAHFEHLYVEDGSSFTLASASALGDTTMTIHLAGAGSSIGGGALYGGGYTFGVKVILEDDATINASTGAITLQGELGIDNKVLTKKGSNDLYFNNGINTTTGSSGTLKVTEGRLYFNFTTNADTAFRNFNVELAGGTLHMANNLSYTIHGLTGTSGSVSSQGNSTLVINTEAEDGNSSTDASTAASIGSNVSITKEGKGKQTISGSFSGKNVTVSGGTLELTGSSLSATGDVTIDGGTLTTTKSLTLTAGSLTASSGSMNVGGDLTVTTGDVTVEGAEVSIDDSLTVGGDLELTAGSLEATSAEVTGSVTASGGSLTTTNTLSADSVSVSGGSVEVGGAFTATQDVSVTGGYLRLGHTSSTIGGTLTVDGGELRLGMLTLDWSGRSSALQLQGNGRVVLDMESTAGTANINLGEVEVGTGGGNLEWSAKASNGQTLTLTKVTGSGDLYVAEMSGTSTANNRELNLELIEDYTGTISGAANSAAQYNKVYVGTVSMAQGLTGQIQLAAGTKVYARDFAKTGEGSFAFHNTLVVEDTLRMNHDGSITFGDGLGFELLQGITLAYDGSGTAGPNLFTLGSDLFAGFEVAEGSIELSLANITEDTLMVEGMKLGITWQESGSFTKEDLEAMILLTGVDPSTQFHLEWKDEGGSSYAYLVVDYLLVAGSLWDAAWGSEVLEAPGAGEMSRGHELNSSVGARLAFGEDTAAGEFDSHALQLAAENSAYYNTNKDAAYIRLTVGSENSKATVVGGRIYTDELTDTDAHTLQLNSYISFAPAAPGAHLHMLVGGSSCLAEVEPASGTYGLFIGNSHIQMDGEGSSVDYIVGGNHVNNTAFEFRGNSYISVIRGNVNGAIVGGSTLTKGSNDSDVFAFSGNTNIFIYTLLSTPEQTPAISDATASATGNQGAAFGAVVGGNAWVDLPTSAGSNAMNPTFNGNTNITIDLVNEQHKGEETVSAEGISGVFDKDIVGGNYTAMQGDGSEVRSTTFQGGDAHITILADTMLHTFTGSISGASRRATGGAGMTTFDGNTFITIDGGNFTDVIAGGFRFDSSATGSHTSLLHGNTSVTLKDGAFWRVAGGSYSLGGNEGAVEEIQGDTRVSISGGSFGSKGTAQTDIGFVVGGSFFRNNAGAAHAHQGDTSVSISGGSFTNVHIVGGDYANFDNPQGAAPASTINGAAEVGISGGSITGLVVGGSYLTDGGKGGTVTVENGTTVSISGGTLKSETVDHKHPGIAVVAGSVILDLESGSHAGTGGHSAVVGGTSAVEVSGGSVSGHIVGGSYSNEAGGQNSLSAESVSITLSGGSVKGNVYGGHYSESTAGPDELTLDSVEITVDGSVVNGSIVGGSYRAATNGTDQSTGDISIALVSGTLNGDVYAAGWHSATSATSLNSTVESTTVTVGSGFSFGTADHTVSGGYYKGDAAHDKSTVSSSTLVFDSTGGYTENGALKNITFADFATVEVTNDTSVWLKELRTGDSNITKTGKGKLFVTNLGNASGGAYAGRITVQEGTLVLSNKQSLNGGLSIDLTGRTAGNAGNAILQGNGGLTGSGIVNLELNVDSANDLKLGSFYLASGLEGLTLANFKDSEWAGTLWSVIESYNDAQSTDSARRKLALVITADNELVLRVSRLMADELYWEGDPYDQSGNDSKVWRDDDVENWQEMDRDWNETASHNVNFDESSGGDVRIDGTVTPNDVNVSGGSYVFKQHREGATGATTGLNMSGTLNVGGGDAAAELELQLASSSIPNINLKENGTLTLTDADAIGHTGPGSTGIRFRGGVLAFGEDADGNLPFTSDISTQVAAYGTEDTASTDCVKVQVGAVGEPGDELREDQCITWTKQGNTNNGVELALAQGVEKSGLGTFCVEWTAASTGGDSDSVEGRMLAQGGTLEYHLLGGSVTLGGAEDIQVAEGAVVSLQAEAGAEVIIERSFSSAEEGGTGGLVVIGSDTPDGRFSINADNADFTGSIELRGYDADQVTLHKADALGGKDTTLRLGGRNIVFSADTDASEVRAGEVEVLTDTVTLVGGSLSDAANTSITITGKLTGEAGGVLASGSSSAYHHTLTGDVSEYEGMIVAGMSSTAVFPAPRAINATGSTWTLERHSVNKASTEILAGLAGTGTIIIDYNADVVLRGAIGDANYGAGVTLVHSSEGKEIVIATRETTAEATLDFGAGQTYRLGNADYAGEWNSSNLVADDGSTGLFILTHGTLGAQLAGRSDAVVLNVHTADQAGTDVDAGGNAGSLFEEIWISAGGHLTNVTGSISAGGTGESTTLHLTFDRDNFGAQKTGDSLIQGGKGGVTVNVKELDSFALDFTNRGLVDILKTHRDENAYTWLYVTDGTLKLDASKWNLLGLMTDENSAATTLLAALGFNFAAVDGGAIKLAGTSEDVYLVLDSKDPAGQEHNVTDCKGMEGYKATVVDEGESLNVTLTGTADEMPTINNLVGLEDSNLNVRKSASATGDVDIALNNELVDLTDSPYVPDGAKPENSKLAVDTIFEGAVNGDAGVNFHKTGSGTLTLGSESERSGLRIQGDMYLEDGGLTLRGGSYMRNLYLNYGADAENKGLTIDGGTTTVHAGISELTDSEGTISVTNGGELVLQGTSTLKNTSISGSGDAKLTIGDNSGAGSLVLEAPAQMSGVDVTINSNSTLDIGTSTGNSVNSLTGNGTLAGNGGTLALNGEGSFSGSMEGSGTLLISSGSSLALDNVNTASSCRWNLDNEGSLNIDITGRSLTLGDLNLAQGSLTALQVNTDKTSGKLNVQRLTWDAGAELLIEGIGEGVNVQDGRITLGHIAEDFTPGSLTGVQVKMKGKAFVRYTGSVLIAGNGDLVLNMVEHKENIFVTPGMEKNALAGAMLVWEATDPESDLWKHMMQNPDGDLSKFTDAVVDMYTDGRTDDLNRALAACAGASISALSGAMAQEVERQLNSMRNRAAMADPSTVATELPQMHIWITGHSGYHKLDADGMAPGYTLNSWGGSVGVDIDVAKNTTVGVAISAMYGDLKTDSVDSGRGDLDTTYLSAYARMNHGAWQHTFVATVGTADATLDRTVRYGAASYSTHGETDGFVMGLMYETGYTFVLNKEGTTALQPVFNVQYRHVALNGYSEIGSDAGLNVGDLSYDALTFGAGARLQGIVGEKTLNRTVILEARALVKADVGDRSGTAQTALLNGGATKVEVESAKIGAVGLEIGAGLSLPISRSTTFFLDASAEMRSGYNNLNASAGVKLDF